MSSHPTKPKHQEVTYHETSTTPDNDCEDCWVDWMRVSVIFVLIAATAIAGSWTYLYIQNRSLEAVEAQWVLLASQVIQAATFNSELVFEAVANFARIYPRLAGESNGVVTLPYVTLYNFEPSAQATRDATGISSILYTPLILNALMQAQWELHSAANAEEWLDRSFSFYPRLDWEKTEPPLSNDIWKYNPRGDKPVPTSAAPLSPAWQQSPPPLTPGSIVNFDLSSNGEIARYLRWTLRTSDAVLSDQIIISNGTADEDSSLLEALLLQQAPEQGPSSILFQPVGDTVSGDDDETVVGHILAAIPWTVFLEDLLPQGAATAVTVVVESCGGSTMATYQIDDDSSSVKFVGTGDLHNTDYSNYVVVAPFAHQFGTLAQRTNLESYCAHTLHVFPATGLPSSFGDSSTTAHRDATIYTSVVVVVLVLALALFGGYDWLMRRRQRRLVAQAKEQAAAVDLVFNNNNTKAGSTQSSHQSISTEQEVGDYDMHAEKKLPEEEPVHLSPPPSPKPKPVPKKSISKKKAKKKKKEEATTAESAAPAAVAGTDLESKKNDGGDAEPLETRQALLRYAEGGIKIDDRSKPIAELFPDATVLFSDISGFTAWSSIREPQQVFLLLESIFGAFDKIAKQRGVFKVETVGDCYVAVCGLPEPNEDHALVMARFARECMERVNEVISELELTLGPDTAELAMRFGIHSGPITAGVLRGDRARFQLFGDTVNTASRIETTGKRNRIHLSEQTASLIVAAGKKSWIIEREDEVQAKGKGVIKTYWLLTLRGGKEDADGRTDDNGDNNKSGEQDFRPKSSFMERIRAIKESRASKEQRTRRLIDWNSEMLIQLLKQVCAKRAAITMGQQQQQQRKSTSSSPSAAAAATLSSMARSMGEGRNMVVEEVAEIITLPEYDDRITKAEAANMELPPNVTAQIKSYVAVIANMYRNNPFHNFEHASHVTMSVNKLLSRIIAPQIPKATYSAEEKIHLLHDHTYGITSDPLTQFAVVLSALIHDVDHRGVPNFLLIKEEKNLAARYQNKSVAEQNSVDLAWQALMSDEYEDLRMCIFSDIGELRRFRQLLVNTVIATDIFDKELGTARKARWNKAFSDENDEFKEEARAATNRKATIVIEHLIQASDVAHTMQHWHVYTKWNERLFQEMYDCYRSGRWEKDPSAGWYQGELGFLDNYVIPLAKKLKDCGVFGVSSDEYLNYAEQNRREWEARGKEVVASFMEKHAKKQAAQQQQQQKAAAAAAAANNNKEKDDDNNKALSSSS